MSIKTVCPMCKDSGWVCEEHPNQPFEHTFVRGFLGYRQKLCSGAGMPCKCNTYSPPWNYPDQTRTEIL